MRKAVFAFVAVVVLLALAVIFYVRVFTAAEPKLTAPLAEIIPEKWDGWTIEERPLAETEGMREYVSNLLQFDQCVSRVFKKGDLEVVFYVAYWAPGGKTPFDAGGHNPDSCWVNFGWTRTAREYSVAGRVLDGRELLPYEAGTYEKDGVMLSAVFWHIVNGEPIVYKEQKTGWRDGLAGAIERTSLRLEDFKRYGLNQRREQMFVRLSFPNQSAESVWANPDFHRLLLAVSRLGIFCDEGWH